MDGAALADQVIADLERIAVGDWQASLTLTDASALSGYSADHLSRLIREGKLANRGRKGKPLVRRSELPPVATAQRTKSPLCTGKPLPRIGLPRGCARSVPVRD